MKKLLIIVVIGAITLYLQGMIAPDGKTASAAAEARADRAAASATAQETAASGQAAQTAQEAPVAAPQEIAIQVAPQAPPVPAPAGYPGQWMWIHGAWVDSDDMGGQACVIS